MANYISKCQCHGEMAWIALANDGEISMQEILAWPPQRAKRFDNAMSSWTQGAGYDLKHRGDAYPWASLGEDTVVDVIASLPPTLALVTYVSQRFTTSFLLQVGSSYGSVCIRLIASFLSLTFAVQGFSPVVEASSS